MSSSLRMGARGENVKAAQEAINAFVQANPGAHIQGVSVDGKYGGDTKRAVRDIQRAFNKKAGPDIAVDGIVGRNTRSVLGLAGGAEIKTSAQSAIEPASRRERHGRRQPVGNGTGPREEGTRRAGAVDRASIRGASHGAVNTLVGDDNSNITPYKPASHRYATVKTAAIVNEIARRWKAKTGEDLRLGDISARGGGVIPDHKAHRSGKNVDIDFGFNDGRTTAASNRDGPSAQWNIPGTRRPQPAYDRAKTQELINTIREVVPGATIFFNDPEIRGVSHLRNHDNHIHIQGL